jgi:hypothetical protein
MTTTPSKKIGVMISASPGTESFEQAIAAAQSALQQGALIYLYSIDAAVEALADPRFSQLKSAGVNLFACAYSLQRRGLTSPLDITPSGLTVLSDILASADEFQSFN